MNSNGSAAKENAVFMESLQGQLNSLNSAFSKFANESLNSGVVSGFLKASTAALNFATAIGGLPTILLAVGTAIVAMNWSSIVSGAGKTISLFQSLYSTLQVFIPSLTATKSMTEAYAMTQTTLATTTGAATASVTALKVAMGGFIALGVVAVVTGISKAFDALNVTVEEQTEKVNKLQSEYESLSNQVDTLRSKTDKTDSEEKYLDILEKQLELKKQALELEKQELLLKEITGKGEWFSSGEFGEMASAVSKAKTYIDEYNAAVKACGELSGESFTKASQTATTAKESLITLTSSMTESYNKIKQGIDAGILTGENLSTAQAYVVQYEAIIQVLEEMGVISSQTATETDNLALSIEGLTNAALPNQEALDAITESADNAVEVIHMLNEAIALQTAGMSLSAEQIDELLKRYPSLYTAVVQTADGYRIDIEKLKELRVEAADTFQTEINGSVDSCNQVIADTKKKIQAYQAELESLRQIKQIWQGVQEQKKASNAIPSFLDMIDDTPFGMSGNIDRQISKFEGEIDSANQVMKNAQATLDKLGSEAKRVEIASSDLGNAIKEANEKAAKSAKTSKKEIKDYADEIANLGKSIKETIVDLTELEQNFYKFKQGKVNDAFKEQTMSLEEINNKMYACRVSLTKLQKEYEALSKNTKGDKAKEKLDALNDKMKEQQEILKELTSQAKAYNDELKATALNQLKEEQTALNNIISQTITLIKKRLNEEKQGYEDIIDSLEDRYDKEVDELEEMVEAKKDAINDELDALKESVSERKKIIEKESKAETTRLKEQLKAYQDIINKRKELLDSEESERSYLEELAEKQQELADLQQQLQEVSGSTDTLEGRTKYLQLQEEIAKKEKEISDFQRDWSIEQQKAALDKLLEEKEENINSQIEAVEDGCDEESDALDDMLDEKEKQLKEDLKYWESYLETEKNKLKQSLDEQVAQYKSYIADIETQLEQEGQLRLQAMKEIENGGSELYNSLLEYNKLYVDGVGEDLVNSWELATKAMEKYSNKAGVLGTLDGLEEAIDAAESGESITVDRNNDNKVTVNKSESSSSSSSSTSSKAKQQLAQQKYLHDLMVGAQAEGNKGLITWIKNERKKWGEWVNAPFIR